MQNTQKNMKKWKKAKEHERRKTKLVSLFVAQRTKKEFIMSFIIGVCVFLPSAMPCDCYPYYFSFSSLRSDCVETLFSSKKIENFWRLNTRMWKTELKNANIKNKTKLRQSSNGCVFASRGTSVCKVNLLLLCWLVTQSVCMRTLFAVGMMVVIKFMKTEDMKADECVCVCVRN